MAASTLTTVAYIYKRKYSDRAVGDLAMRDHPFMKMASKEGGFNGSAWFYPIRYGNPQGISATFADAQTAASESKGLQLQASRKKKYGIITLDGEAMAAAEGNGGAFLDLVTQETDGVIEEHGDTLSFELYRDGKSDRGRRSSISTNTVTLTVADDARNFKVGMTVIASPNQDGSSPRTGSTTIAAVNEDAGTVTLTSAAAITSFADNDYLFRLGDANAGIEGLAAHLPLTAPASGESFRSVDRSVDTRRLAGVRVDDTGTPVEENAGNVAVKIAQVGKKANVLFLNPIKFWEVSRRLNAKVEYDGGGMKAAYGFESFDVHSPAGTLRAISDADCPPSRGYVLNLSCWYHKHLKGFVHIISDDGRPNLRKASEDSIEARTRSMGNLCCTEPGSNGVFSI